MTKEELIKEAWGEYYDIVKDKLNTNGWYSYFSLDNKVRLSNCSQFKDLILDEHKEIPLLRPKSLQGIENNNGWIKIESEEDLPKNFNRYEFKLYYWTNNGLYESEDYKRWKIHYNHLEVTHYRLEPIFNTNPPLY